MPSTHPFPFLPKMFGVWWHWEFGENWKNLEFLSFFYHLFIMCLSFFYHFRDSFNVFQNAGSIFGENLQKPGVFVIFYHLFIMFYHFLILRNFWARMISSGKSLNHSHPSPSPSSLGSSPLAPQPSTALNPPPPHVGSQCYAATPNFSDKRNLLIW